MSLRLLAVVVLALAASACASPAPIPVETLYTPPEPPGAMQDQAVSEQTGNATGGETLGTYPRPFDGWQADGEQLTIWWQTGPAPCHVLDRVALDQQTSQVIVTLYEGYEDGSDPATVACAEQVRTVFTQVALDEPVGRRDVVDGVTGRPILPAPVP